MLRSIGKQSGESVESLLKLWEGFAEKEAGMKECGVIEY